MGNLNTDAKEIFSAEGNRYLAACEKLKADPATKYQIARISDLIDRWCFEDGFAIGSASKAIEDIKGPLSSLFRKTISFYAPCGEGIEPWDCSDEAELGVPAAILTYFRNLSGCAPDPRTNVSELSAAVAVILKQTAEQISLDTLSLESMVDRGLLCRQIADVIIQFCGTSSSFMGSLHIYSADEGVTLYITRLGLKKANLLADLARKVTTESSFYPQLFGQNDLGASVRRVGSDLFYDIDVGATSFCFFEDSPFMEQLRAWHPELVASVLKKYLNFCLEPKRNP